MGGEIEAEQFALRFEPVLRGDPIGAPWRHAPVERGALLHTGGAKVGFSERDLDTTITEGIKGASTDQAQGHRLIHRRRHGAAGLWILLALDLDGTLNEIT